MVVLSGVGGCYLGDNSCNGLGLRTPLCRSPLPFPSAHLPLPPPSVQVLERPLEDGGCDPEEPERRWV